jgi:hypothetical protein
MPALKMELQEFNLQIEYLKFHFQGGQFILYHFFWLRIHDILTWKRTIIPNFWVLVKISSFLLTQNIIQIVVLSTFEMFNGTITSYITVNFPTKPSKIFPCVSIGMWNHWLHCWIWFLQLLLNFIHSRHELIDVLVKKTELTLYLLYDVLTRFLSGIIISNFEPL